MIDVVANSAQTTPILNCGLHRCDVSYLCINQPSCIKTVCASVGSMRVRQWCFSPAWFVFANQSHYYNTQHLTLLSLCTMYSARLKLGLIHYSVHVHVSRYFLLSYIYTILHVISSPEHQRLQSSSSSNWSLSTDGEVSYQLHIMSSTGWRYYEIGGIKFIVLIMDTPPPHPNKKSRTYMY